MIVLVWGFWNLIINWSDWKASFILHTVSRLSSCQVQPMNMIILPNPTGPLLNLFFPLNNKFRDWQTFNICPWPSFNFFLKVLGALINFLWPSGKVRPPISFDRFLIFKICQVGGRTLNNHQIQSFEVRYLFFYILSSSYIKNLCKKNLKIKYFC